MKNHRDSALTLFESEQLRNNFLPLSLTRPTFDFLLGTRSIFHRIEKACGRKVSHVIVPKYLEAITKQNHPDVKVNEKFDGETIVVNSLVSPRVDPTKHIEDMESESIVVDQEDGIPVLGLFSRLDPKQFGVQSKRNRTNFRPVDGGALIKYPWEFFEQNSFAIEQDFKQEAASNAEGPRQRGPNCEILGQKIILGDSSEVSGTVTIDARKGPVIVEGGVQIQSFSLIQGPAFIGRNTVVKSARIREGTSIGENCRVAGEIEKTVIFEYSNKSHEGFLGHSIVGSWVNLGALTTNSDLKNTYGEIKVETGGRTVRTGTNKVGVIIGDMAKTSIGTMIFSGKKIGVSSHVFGTIAEDVPSFTMYGKSFGSRSSEIFLDSAIETQKRMKERRGLVMSSSEADLMKYIFKVTAKERRKAHVTKRRFELGIQ